MRYFTLPIPNEDGTTTTVSLAIGEVVEGVHPLAQQARWLQRSRGIEIPPAVMDAMGKLAELALDNGVSFEELCLYAVGAREDVPVRTRTGAPPG